MWPMLLIVAVTAIELPIVFKMKESAYLNSSGEHPDLKDNK
jgi:hypothetical protein